MNKCDLKFIFARQGNYVFRKEEKVMAEDKNNSFSVKLESMIELLSTLIKEGKEEVITLINSDETPDKLEVAKIFGSEVSSSIKIIKVIRKTASIPDKFFMHKIERYCAGLVEEIPVEKRKKYAEKVGKKTLNEDSVFILGVLNKIEELSKIDIFVKLFALKMDGVIDDPTYRRMMLQVERTMYSDILFLSDKICNNSVEVTSVEVESLLAAGWLIFAGFGEGGVNLYSYTQTAKQFCKIVYKRDPNCKDNIPSKSHIIFAPKKG